MISNDSKKDTALVKKITERLLELMSIEAAIEVNEDKENDALIVKINTPKEAGLIIGSRGRTLNSVQVILGMIYRKKSGSWKRIIVDVSGWRDKEKERLIGLATLTAQRAEETGKPQSLYNLTPSQRRTIHLFLAEKHQIKNTTSQTREKGVFLVI